MALVIISLLQPFVKHAEPLLVLISLLTIMNHSWSWIMELMACALHGHAALRGYRETDVSKPALAALAGLDMDTEENLLC